MPNTKQQSKHWSYLVGKRFDPNRLPLTEILCQLIRPAQKRFERNTIAYNQEQLALPQRQCKGAHVRKFKGYKLLAPPAYYPYLAPSDYFLVSKLEEMARWKEIWPQK